MATKSEVAKSNGDSGRNLPTIDRAFGTFYGEMNRMFEDFFHREPFKHFGLPRRLKSFDWSPTVDVAERPDSYEISAELPGLEEKDISVSVDGDVLTISGERKVERKEDTKDVHIMERHYGSFVRSFTLPEDADAAKIGAEFKNGVLNVTIGRSHKPHEGARKIAVKASA